MILQYFQLIRYILQYVTLILIDNHYSWSEFFITIELMWSMNLGNAIKHRKFTIQTSNQTQFRIFYHLFPGYFFLTAWFNWWLNQMTHWTTLHHHIWDLPNLILVARYWMIQQPVRMVRRGQIWSIVVLCGWSDVSTWNG